MVLLVFFSNNLMHKFLILIHLLHSSTCFEHYCAHLQEDNYINTASGIVTLETSEWSYLLKYILYTLYIVYIYIYIYIYMYTIYIGYLESKYRLRISLVHPRDCHFAHVQLRSHRRHFVKFVLCLCLFLRFKHV